MDFFFGEPAKLTVQTNVDSRSLAVAHAEPSCVEAQHHFEGGVDGF